MGKSERAAPKRNDALPRALYPGLYGWQVAYQSAEGSVSVCSCFRDAWNRYFVYLREGLPKQFLRTHRELISGNKLRRVAFSRCVSRLHPIAIQAFFPGAEVLRHEPHIIDGREFYSLNEIKAPPLDDSFWETPSRILFSEKLCDVCTGRLPRHCYCHKTYGSAFATVYGAWIQAELVRQGYIDLSDYEGKLAKRSIWNEAENKLRMIVGVPKIGEQFISETMLWKAVAYLLKDHEVIHHYRAPWLGRQELDIYVPALKLGIEYQGEQHFFAIDAWGGEEAVAKAQQRDEEKRRKCESNGVHLVYFDHDMKLTEEFVSRCLQSILKKLS